MSHKVSVNLPERELGRADVEFRVRQDGTALGTLRVSKGAVVWVPTNKTYGYKLSWSQFDQIVRQTGTNGHR